MITHPDPERIMHRATQAMASAAGDLAAQLGVTQEHLELAQVRLAELERDRQAREAELGAELGQLRQANALLQARVAELEEDRHSFTGDLREQATGG